MPIRGEGLADGAGDDGAREYTQVTYMLHPNCGIFDET